MKIVLPPKRWSDYKKSKLDLLLSKHATAFTTLKHVPREEGGIYLITLLENKKEHALYIGRATKLHRRIYTNHLMGPLSNARLKKYLLADETLTELLKMDKLLAKEYIKQNCWVRWITDDEISKGCPFKTEPTFRLRGALEGYFVGVLFPKYGIYKEH